MIVGMVGMVQGEFNSYVLRGVLRISPDLGRLIAVKETTNKTQLYLQALAPLTWHSRAQQLPGENGELSTPLLTKDVGTVSALAAYLEFMRL